MNIARLFIAIVAAGITITACSGGTQTPPPEEGAGGAPCSEGAGGGSPEPDAGAPACMIPDPGVWDLQNTPCNNDHDCARWSPCIDARCDLEKPQDMWPGTCVIAIQVEPVYCGAIGDTRYTCSPQGECCPEIPW